MNEPEMITNTNLENKVVELIRHPDLYVDGIDIYREFRNEFKSIESCYVLLRKLEADKKIQRNCSGIKTRYIPYIKK